MTSKENKQLIANYMEAYNSFDVEGMVKHLHMDILFRNYSNNELNTETRGVEAFRELAENSSKLFSSRRQSIIDYSETDGKVEVTIDYEGKLAADLPNGLKSGDTIQLKGKSVFGIKDAQIEWIEDYS